MEYIPGETLYMKLQEYDTVSLAKMAFSCGKMLSRLHGKSICLVDSSLSNYLINPHGQLFLVDFENSSRRKFFEWDVAAFFLSFERLDICKKKEIKKSFFEGYASCNDLDLKKVEYIQNMLKPYMLVSSLDYVMRFKR
jgi:tRNA A-37 threonylcarbamoyl transferase component Bud32